MSSSDFGLTNEELVYELHSILHSYILDIFTYGIYTSIYFVALYLTLSRGNDRPRVGSAILITVMWILVTIHASISWAYIDNIYIRHGESREAQLSARMFSQHGELFSQGVADASVTFVSLLLADITMIWRCWVLYGQRWLVVIPPGLLLTAGSACYLWRTIVVFTFDPVWSTDQVTNLELSFLTTTVVTNIFCTVAIIYRIVGVSGWRRSLKTYHNLMEILIESSIMYTVVYAIRIGMQIHSHYFTEELDERALFAKALGASITGIAPTLIIARVAAGFARPDDSWARTSLPHIRSTMQSFAESLQFVQPTTNTVADSIDLERRSKEGGGPGDSRLNLSSGEMQKEKGEGSYKE